MDLQSYHRTVFAFHGCDRRIRDAVLLGRQKLLASLNTYDWLGTGIYFWEHGPGRALEWAIQQSKRKIPSPSNAPNSSAKASSPPRASSPSIPWTMCRWDRGSKNQELEPLAKP